MKGTLLLVVKVLKLSKAKSTMKIFLMFDFENQIY